MKKCRSRAKITQLELANFMGISKGTVNDLEQERFQLNDADFEHWKASAIAAGEEKARNADRQLLTA